ncbi:MAG: GNAT family N-acetyltransferase [Actinomycetes bacterium]
MSPVPGFEVRRGLTQSQMDDLLGLYAGEWWTKDRTPADVERMLAATDLVFAVVEDSSRAVVGFARVLTDRTYVALVLDVIVAPAYRARGLGRLLVETILAEPSLKAVRSIELVCQPEHVPFYERWGFSASVGRSGLMRRTADPRLRAPVAQDSAAGERDD